MRNRWEGSSFVMGLLCGKATLYGRPQCQGHLGSPAARTVLGKRKENIVFRSELVLGFDGNIGPDSLLKSTYAYPITS